MQHAGKAGVAVLIAALAAAFAYSRQSQAATRSNIMVGDDAWMTPSDDGIWTEQIPATTPQPVYNWTWPTIVAQPVQKPDPVINAVYEDATEQLLDFGYTPSEIPPLGANMNWKVNDYPKYASAIRDAELRYGIPTDLIGRVLYQESRFLPDIIAGDRRSSVGAIGIGQFMPATAAEYGIDPRDPFASIDATGRYLKRLYAMFNNWRDALMGYNWGEGNVAKWKRGDINPKTGKPYTPPGETANYVAKITADVYVV